MQAKSKTKTDKFWAWAHEMVGSGNHGDLVRLWAGGRAAANQIEFIKEYGSAHPNDQITKDACKAAEDELEFGSEETSLNYDNNNNKKTKTKTN